MTNAARKTGVTKPETRTASETSADQPRCASSPGGGANLRLADQPKDARFLPPLPPVGPERAVGGRAVPRSRRPEADYAFSEPDPGDEAEHWRERAACRGMDQFSFFGNEMGVIPPIDLAFAKATCAVCLVKDQCLSVALSNRERYGIWGGLTPAERRHQGARRGYCKRGHPLRGPDSDSRINAKGHAICRICRRLTRRYE